MKSIHLYIMLLIVAEGALSVSVIEFGNNKSASIEPPIAGPTEKG